MPGWTIAIKFCWGYSVQILNEVGRTKRIFPSCFNFKIHSKFFIDVICQKQSIYNIEVVVHLNVDGKWILSQGCDKQMKCTNDLGKGT